MVSGGGRAQPDGLAGGCRPLRQYRACFAELPREGIEEGSLQAVDSSLASSVLLSFATGLLALGLLDPEGEDWGDEAKGGIGLLLDGLRQP